MHALSIRIVAASLLAVGWLGGVAGAVPLTDDGFEKLLSRYCTDCHGTVLPEGDFDLAGLLNDQVSDHAAKWEHVVRKLDGRQMPPVAAERPGEAEYSSLRQYLVERLDAAAKRNPNPGHVDGLRRLNRTEYQNAVRDLLAVEIDAADLLPADESSHGFDHITVGDLSPGLLTRYVRAAETIARLAVGTPTGRPDGKTFRIKADVTQDRHVPGLPLGTRGGGLFRHHFQEAGEYEVQVRLTRDRNDEVEGLHGKHQLEVLLDGKRVAAFDVERPKSGKLADFDDSRLRARFEAPAGPHELGATFVRRGASVEETKRQPLNVHFNLHRHPRLNPAIYEVSVTGPLGERTPSVAPQETPSRKRILVTTPEEEGDVESAARKVLRPLARRAYRRPVDDADMQRLLRFFRQRHEEDGFEAGIEAAIAALLTSPHFLLKIERVPEGVSPGEPYLLSDHEFASRLSFFLWSSIPDDDLLHAADRGVLRQSEVLERQVKRMLADDRAANLATNFAGQWLHLRNLDAITPDGRLYPDFDENLRRAMRRETELHIGELVENDGSLLELLRTDHTYVNERLAKHYGIPHVYGSRFRRVELPPGSHRGGLLRQGSILTVTSYATRTSPVIRGNWVLENILGAPAPPPPENVPSLDAMNVVSESLTIRERLEQHRKNPACASCHDLMDPVGFALENFDAVGQWREREADDPVDVRGGLPDGSEFRGVDGLELAILRRPGLFVTATTEKLLTFAIGRGVEPTDGPAVRAIVREAAEDDYRLSTIVLGIVRSTPFQSRVER